MTYEEPANATNYGRYTAVLNVTGASKICGYNISKSASVISTAEAYIAKSTGKYTYYQWVDVVDGKATVVFQENSRKTDYYVWGYNVDSEGNLEELQSEPLVFNIATSLAK